MIKKIAFGLAAGALFAAGLVVSGMTQTAKVINFLNFGGIFAPERFGAWDASLGFCHGRCADDYACSLCHHANTRT